MRQRAENPIGIFDSGIGGLTNARAIIDRLPGEDVIYVGDTAHLPYGEKSPALIKYYAIKITEFLIARKCKLIVIACNTASSVAFDELVEIFGDRVTFINVVDPIVSRIAADEEAHKVGIIGTKGTIQSGIYASKLKAARPQLETVSMATPLLAPMIEAGFFDNNISRSVIESYLEDPQFKGIDGLILACTHYPLIRKEIEAYYQDAVRVVDSTAFVAEDVEAALAKENLLNTQTEGERHFFATDITESFSKTTRIFFGEKVKLEFCGSFEA